MTASTERELSIVIKALNEESNIERTLRSVFAATDGLDVEVILADSLSTDDTVKIARRFPITVVQLENARDRSCGIGAQLGYQHSAGRFVLVMDGDMEIEQDWLLAALNRLRADPTIGGIGGMVEDVNLENIEFRARRQRKSRELMVGEVDRLYGGGLFRRSAIEAAGYLTNRNLHACEELELGLRFWATGWRMERLNMVSMHHYGHTAPIWILARKRWKSRYVNGAGELIRASIGRPWFKRALASFKLQLLVLAWGSTIAVLSVASMINAEWLFWMVFVVLLPPTTMVFRKRSLSLGLYSIFAWTIDTMGLVRGILTPQLDPTLRVASRVVHTPERRAA